MREKIEKGGGEEALFLEAGTVTEQERDRETGQDIFPDASTAFGEPADPGRASGHCSGLPNYTPEDPFSVLKFQRCRKPVSAGSILLVMPLTGHHAVLVRDLVLSLAATHDVAVLDWHDARDVPACLGPFGLDDQINAIAAAINAMPAPAHVVGICQSALPVLTAAAALASRHSSAPIYSLALMGAPFDPAANPTILSTALQASSRLWLELIEITTVDAHFKGAGRRIYPGAQQRIRVQHYIQRHSAADSPFYRKLCEDDGLDPQRYPFWRSLTVLKDLPAEAFLENIDRHYHRPDDAGVVLSLSGEVLDPGALRDVAVLTVEGESDDIVAPGQTSSIHEDLPQSAGTLREHLSVPCAGHFDLFHGRICRQTIAPQLLSFFARVTASHALAGPELGGLPDGEHRQRDR